MLVEREKLRRLIVERHDALEPRIGTANTCCPPPLRGLGCLRLAGM